jgi:hypothetical protein
MVVTTEFEKARVKVDSLAMSFENDGLEIIVEAGSDDAPQVAEGVDVTLKKVLLRLLKEELEVEGAAIGESQNKAGETALRAADSDRPERGPIDLSLFTGQDREAQKGFARPRAKFSDDAAQL